MSILAKRKADGVLFHITEAQLHTGNFEPVASSYKNPIPPPFEEEEEDEPAPKAAVVKKKAGRPRKSP